MYFYAVAIMQRFYPQVFILILLVLFCFFPQDFSPFSVFKWLLLSVLTQLELQRETKDQRSSHFRSNLSGLGQTCPLPTSTLVFHAVKKADPLLFDIEQTLL